MTRRTLPVLMAVTALAASVTSPPVHAEDASAPRFAQAAPPSPPQSEPRDEHGKLKGPPHKDGEHKGAPPSAAKPPPPSHANVAPPKPVAPPSASNHSLLPPPAPPPGTPAAKPAVAPSPQPQGPREHRAQDAHPAAPQAATPRPQAQPQAKSQPPAPPNASANAPARTGPTGSGPAHGLASPAAPPAPSPTLAATPQPPATRSPVPVRLQDLQGARTQRVEDGGKRTIIEEPGNRTIVRQDNRVFIHHDETERFRRLSPDMRAQRRPDGTTETIIVRPGGIQIFSVTDGDGRLVRRYRRDGGGREIDIIDNRHFFGGRDLAIGVGIGALAVAAYVALAPPVVTIPRERYIVEYERASPADLAEVLYAPPIERLERAYSLEEIRYSHELRQRMRRIDLDTIVFETGSWAVGVDQAGKLEHVAHALREVIERHPDEVFLIEGHTDAVGSDVDNLTLSDRRAESVAEVLSASFGVPPENLVTQGYGKQFLKVPTEGPERANRRVAIRRITPLLAHAER